MNNNYDFVLKEIYPDLTDKQLKQFTDYYDLLVEWNTKMNLTAITEKKEVYWKHFYDSIVLGKYIDLNNEFKICDIGSGAGFPIIPLKIVFPNLQISVVDALNKRIVFLNEVVNKLGLTNVELYHARAEDFIKEHREEYDIVTARAVARMNVLSELCIPFVKIGGRFIALKGADGINELIESKNACKVLGAELSETIEFHLPFDESKRVIHIITKIKKSPGKYPRLFSKIKKNPL
ncbi:16S rRNA (guanine(527)-N(7))-methyltransferase RsmG [Culicoidibacter larvae]|uniref:Ribosomal RNA small subunit methyltransferase G n=1 Tax=Culicoidibacter larvae TaxID=2579976 RepID=A0A5R8QIT9_9FIRM|nr:16S rRNA (guanine(527)-N(7))-methyltransferase RsmG [Culicoidibacter larvae]TLG77167.1 16S rRNA (guanine(527)-N(7))-methyltransferase RsmG [Culicoidibacter larvae]